MSDGEAQEAVDGNASVAGAMQITVSDAEKHGTSVTSAYVDFRVQTRTNLKQYAACDFFVRRRYRDFVWLRGQLCHSHPSAVVPPIPGVDSLVKDDRFSHKFIARRQAGLQLFLRRVAAHAALRTSTDLQARAAPAQLARPTP